MLLDGSNHVASLTTDTGRFVDFYRQVFDAEVTGSTEMDGHGTLTFVRVGPHSEVNLFELRGTPQRNARRRCSDGVGSTTLGSRPGPSTPSRRSGAA